ncbi:anthranilate synthase component I [Formicincola oecophyllae]|uniref:Anthranilate synthase component 1 n=1 Tax=Formicincola oecophyllae TaxID=2558361 RepID=A0A4Y6U956_9PROT|nr:chorismate-binding protein [Formicincola oecophyllae]QDH13989.1 anthranilate synthase component I [Formicincola oecophyllae]
MSKILYRTRSADLLTPLAVFMRLSALATRKGQGAHRIFLESVEGGAARGRYSIIALMPDVIWRCQDGVATRNGKVQAEPPLDALRALIAESQMDLPEAMPAVVGGLCGVLGYDMVRQMERLPPSPPDDVGLAEAIMVRPRLFAVIDTVRDELTLAVPVRAPQPGAPEHAGEEAAAALLDEAEAALDGPFNASALAESLPPGSTLAHPEANMTKGRFLEGVAKAQAHIAAGDAFQIVLSQRFQAPFPLSPLALYRSLRRINPSPFMFLMDLGDYTLVGASPEILVRLKEGEVTVRPLAGTRRRGATKAEDEALERELLADAKERSEHLMLLDLGRNDVGRVSRPGTVRVPESFAVERYSHVMHITSMVTGQVRGDVGPVEALSAGFPAGTLTGAPKIRAMEILSALEPTKRGPYAGCVGWFGANGEMDTCIGLRMAVVKDGTMYVQAGAGIVADSNPEAEYEETRAKARALFTAAERAVAMAASLGGVKGHTQRGGAGKSEGAGA